jgi:hypothetical protein
MKKRFALFAVPFIVVVIAATAATAAGPRPKRGDVTGATPDTFSAAWVTGVSQDGGAKGTSIKMTDFAFYSFRNWWDHNLSDVKKVQASWHLDGVNGGGSPISLELDVNADGAFDCEPGPCVNDVVVYPDPATCSDTRRPAMVGWSRTSPATGRTAPSSTAQALRTRAMPPGRHGANWLPLTRTRRCGSCS